MVYWIIKIILILKIFKIKIININQKKTIFSFYIYINRLYLFISKFNFLKICKILIININQKTLNDHLTIEESSTVAVDENFPFFKWRKINYPEFPSETKMIESSNKKKKQYNLKSKRKIIDRESSSKNFLGYIFYLT
jgi:hypothetical protein